MRLDLIRQGMPLARRIAFAMARRFSVRREEANDLVGAGMEGLLKAERTYNGKTTFESWAATCVYGAVYDALRSQDVLTRHGRRQAGAIAGAKRKLEGVLGRPADEQEVATALGLDLAAYQKRTEVLARGPASRRFGETDLERVSVDGTLAEELALRERKIVLYTALRQLDVRKQQIIDLYYLEDRSLDEIGTLLQVTPSRVCQLLKEALRELRKQKAFVDYFGFV